MKSVRRIHGWLGLLFAPSIVLFALSGMFQMYGCHEGEDASGLASTLAQIHMHQVPSAPARRAPPPAPRAETAAPGNGAAPAAAAPEARREGPPRARPANGPIKAFFLLMSLGLIASSVLGAYIGLASKRDRRLHIGLLAAGFVIPIVLLAIT